MSQQLPFLVRLLKALVNLVILGAIAAGTWLIGTNYQWHWGDFMSNAFSAGISGLVIGLIFLWSITRPTRPAPPRNAVTWPWPCLKLRS